MYKFETGDQVICVDNRWVSEIYKGLILPEKGKKYTIRSCDEECCTLMEVKNFYVKQQSGVYVNHPYGEEPVWFVWHFEKVNHESISESISQLETIERVI